MGSLNWRRQTQTITGGTYRRGVFDLCFDFDDVTQLLAPYERVIRCC